MTEGTSMMPTINTDSIVLLESINSQKLERGDIILFQHDELELEVLPEKNGEDKSKLKKSSKKLMKRIIGLPNETVEIRKNIVFINHRKLEENYTLHQKFDTWEWDILYNLKENEYFVLGDNRDDSLDSRYFGLIQREQIERKYVKCLMDFSHISDTIHNLKRNMMLKVEQLLEE